MLTNREFQPIGSLFSPDKFAGFSEAQKRADIEIILCSTSPYRKNSMKQVVESLGIPVVFKVSQGPGIETGVTAAERALNKAIHVGRSIFHDGFFNRHPSQLTILLGVDSRNKRDGEPRDKPRSIAEFETFGDEWLRAKKNHETFVDESGYAVLVMLRGKMWASTITQTAKIHPPTVEVIKREFIPADQFEKRINNAHGIDSDRLIKTGELKITGQSGEIILGQPAIDIVYGSSILPIQTLVISALQNFSEPNGHFKSTSFF